MKRAHKLLLLLLTLILLFSCKALNDNLEAWLKHWTTIPQVTGSSIENTNQGKVLGIYCIELKSSKTIIQYKVKNDLNFELKDIDDVENILTFANLESDDGKDFLDKLGKEPPKRGTVADYTFEFKKAPSEEGVSYFILTLKEDYFKIFKQGSFILKPTIHLISATDGRDFGYYSQEFIINQKPPKIENATVVFDDNSITGKKEYIICFKLPDFPDVHKDVERLHIGDNIYRLNPNNYEISNADGSTPPNRILTNATGMNLKDLITGEAAVIPSGSNIVYFRTNEFYGALKKKYDIMLTDSIGLSSDKSSVFIGANKLEAPKAYDEDNNILNASNITELLIPNKSDGGSGHASIRLKVDNYLNGTPAGSGVSIEYSITKEGSSAGSPQIINSSEASIDLDGSLGGTTYTVTATAKKNGVLDSKQAEWKITVKISAVVVIPIPEDTRTSWNQLRDLVMETDTSAPQIIRIEKDKTIQAFNDLTSPDKEITVSRKVRIEVENGTATIDANSAGGSFIGSNSRRIFNVTGAGDLSISNLILINGKAERGAAVKVENGKFSMYGGKMEKNFATYGGGIYVEGNNSHLTIRGGEIIQNIAPITSSGGVYIQSCKKFVMADTVIKDNKNGGLFLHDASSFEMKGNIKIGGGSQNNTIYMNDINDKIVLSGNITGDKPIQIELKHDGGYYKNRQIIECANTPAGLGLNLADEVKKFEMCPQKNLDGSIKQKWIIDINGTLQKAPIETWAELKDALENGNDEIISLTQDIVASDKPGDNGAIKIERTVTIEGNGHIINANCWYPNSVASHPSPTGEKHRVFTVTGINTFIIKNLTLKGGHTTGVSGGAAIAMGGGPTVIIENSIITGNYAKSKTSSVKGGAVYIGSGTFSMSGTSEISNNKCDGFGGAVYVGSHDTFSMKGGVIKNNKATKGNGVFVENDGGAGKFYLSGTAQVGGGSEDNIVYLESEAMIFINSVLAKNPVVTIEPESYSETYQVLTKGGTPIISDSVFKAQIAKFKLTKTDWHIDDNGKLKKD